MPRVSMGSNRFDKVWAPLIEALVAEAGFDPQHDEAKVTGRNLVITCNFKGSCNRYYLMHHDFHDDVDVETEAVWIADFLREARELRARDGISPHHHLLPRHRMMERIMEHAGIDPQSLLDEIWEAKLGLKALGTERARFRWATAEEPPMAVSGVRRQEPAFVVGSGGGTTYLAGDLLAVGWEIDTAILEDKLALTIEGNSFVATHWDAQPQTVLTALKGRPLTDFVQHPALDHLDIVINVAKHRQGGTALWLGGPAVRTSTPLDQSAYEIPAERLPSVVAVMEDLKNVRWR